MLEAKCTVCDEIFIPHGEDPEDLVHGITEAGNECGGTGVVMGEWLSVTEAALRAVIAQSKAEILRDAQAGHLPVDEITSFSDLHDYVDANTYGGLCDEHVVAVFETNDIENFNRVQNAVDAWIKEGGLRAAVADLGG